MEKLKPIQVKHREVNQLTNEKKAPQNPMTEKNNGLSSTQEVTYQDEFKKAANVRNDEKSKSNDKKQK